MKNIQNSYKSAISLNVPLLKPTIVTTAIAPLQPQEERIISGWERLVAQSERINEIAEELEIAILELKAIASTLKSQKFHPLIKEGPGKNICQDFTVGVPCVRKKPDATFILTMRKVDLCRAEKEAAQLAQQLREQTKNKRLASQRHRKNKNEVETDTKR
ncbi:hypothetical protein WKK05_33025 [Nostoc sp. UHCC 0302]|uniref:hypothetical protein n=1 Tax=Nostoc sp. UHCC 0302 TaxID=3134896 RepID=UPI00311CCC63